MQLLSALMLAAPLSAVADSYTCPGSPAWVHASARVTVVAQAPCEAVMGEMKARVAGQPGRWHDPHNNGTYSLLSAGASTLELSRLTGNKLFTDKLTFAFAEQGGACMVRGCSESQGTSVGDFSTNYCNLRMLYCGSGERCEPVEKDFGIQETEAKTSIGASKDPSACIVKRATVFV